MDFTVFVTVISRVLTYITGQLILKLVIEPVQEVRKTIGQIAYALIEDANVIHNPGMGLMKQCAKRRNNYGSFHRYCSRIFIQYLHMTGLQKYSGFQRVLSSCLLLSL